MNIDEQRQPWESDEHWVFRKEFLTVHEGKFSDDRLLCLAQVFANIELLGCSYPVAVLTQVNELAAAITNLDDLRRKRQESATVKFVKASDGGENNKGCKRKRNTRSGSNSGKKFKKSDGLAHDLSNSDDNSNESYDNSDTQCDSETELSKISAVGNEEKKKPFDFHMHVAKSLRTPERFKKLIEFIKATQGSHPSPTKFLNNCCVMSYCSLEWRFHELRPKIYGMFRKSFKTHPLGNFAGILKINGVVMAKVVAKTPRFNQEKAHEVALSVLLNPKFKLMKRSRGRYDVFPKGNPNKNQEKIPEVKLEDREDANIPPEDELRIVASVLDKRLIVMSELVKVHESRESDVNALIQVAACKSYVRYNIVVEQISDVFIARLFVEGVLISFGSDENEKPAKRKAFSNGLAKIKKSYIKFIPDQNGILGTNLDNEDDFLQYKETFPAIASNLEKRITSMVDILKTNEAEQPILIKRVMSAARSVAIKPFYCIHTLSDPKLTTKKPLLMCRFFLDGVFICSGTGADEDLARESAFNTALPRINQHSIKIIYHPNGVFELVTEQEQIAKDGEDIPEKSSEMQPADNKMEKAGMETVDEEGCIEKSLGMQTQEDEVVKIEMNTVDEEDTLEKSSKMQIINSEMEKIVTTPEIELKTVDTISNGQFINDEVQSLNEN